MPLSASQRPRRGFPKATVCACAFAAVASTPVQAASTCALIATPLVFGNYNPTGGPAVQINAIFTVSCLTTTLPLAPVNFQISIGRGSGNSPLTRAMVGPVGSQLQYNVYTSPSYANVWGDGSSGSTAVSGRVTPLALGIPAIATYTAYGRVPGQQSVRTGVYTDSLLVTIDY
jgi:spore coat protein U-like protein